MSITRKDLVAELARLNDTERQSVLAEVDADARRATRMADTASAIADYIHPTRKD